MVPHDYQRPLSNILELSNFIFITSEFTLTGVVEFYAWVE